MANNRTSESEFEDDLFEDDFANDQELYSEDDDIEFDVKNLGSRERKKYEKMREDIENSVVNALAEGDPDGKFYKGLQRVLAKRDRELSETRSALASLLQRFGIVEDNAQDLEFMKNIVKDMLDEDSRPVMEERYKSFKTQKQQEAWMNQIQWQQQQAQQAQQMGYQRYGTEDDDEQIRQYRKQATEKLKAFARKAGIDPNDKELDYGTEDEPLLARMDKLANSIEKISQGDDEDIEDVRQRTPRAKTRTNNDTKLGGENNEYGRDLLSRGSAQMLNKMRNMR